MLRPNYEVILVLVLAIGLASCTHVPISSMYKLRNLDPTTTDIHKLKFAVRIPNETNIPKDGVKLVLGTDHENQVSIEESFLLIPVSDRSMLNSIEKKGTTVHPYRVATRDLDRFIRIRQRIQYEKTQGAVGKLEIRADVCHVTPKLPTRIPIATFINAVETNGYVALLVNADLLQHARDEGMDRKIQMCGSNDI